MNSYTDDDMRTDGYKDGHKEPNDLIYFRREEIPGCTGWYWCGRFSRSATYGTYQKCLDNYKKFISESIFVKAVQASIDKDIASGALKILK